MAKIISITAEMVEVQMESGLILEVLPREFTFTPFVGDYVNVINRDGQRLIVRGRPNSESNDNKYDKNAKIGLILSLVTYPVTFILTLAGWIAGISFIFPVLGILYGIQGFKGQKRGLAIASLVVGIITLFAVLIFFLWLYEII